jgi:hypothetical protein
MLRTMSEAVFDKKQWNVSSLILGRDAPARLERLAHQEDRMIPKEYMTLSRHLIATMTPGWLVVPPTVSTTGTAGPELTSDGTKTLT